jgi:hypothetical protein
MDRSLSAGAHSEENERDKVPRRRERVAAMERKREDEFIMVVVLCIRDSSGFFNNTDVRFYETV